MRVGKLTKAAVVAVALAGTVGAGVASADGEAHPIRNGATGACLQPEGASTDLFASIVVATCDGSDQQRWFLNAFGGGNQFQIANLRSHLCFDAFDGSFNGARVLQNQCAPISNDQWKFGTTPPALTTIRSRVGFRDNNTCVDVPAGQVTARLVTCNGSPTQQWVVGIG
ncbi:hypothetical protein GCM10029964_081560 [Kibdelosporangium lantanae]